MAKIRKIKEKELIGGTSDDIEVYPITHARAVYDKNNTPLSDTLEFLNTEIVWNNSGTLSNMNDFVVAGVYDIKGERTRIDDNLPVLNTGGGHSFNARLTVLDSSISGSGNSDDKCITQVLSFSNRLGQGEVYIRTGKGSSLDSLTWEKWSTLQRNVNVDKVTSLDHLVDNGIYSGVYVKNDANIETFVMVVINNYALANKNNMPKSISQFKYSVSLGGSFAKYETRVGTGVNDWGEWEILNKDEINSMISAEIKKVNDRISTLIDDNDPDTLDSIKDLVNWVNAHGADATAMLLNIQQNTVKINAEVNRATKKEQEIENKLDDEIERSVAAEGEINQNTIAADSLGCSTTTDDISLEFETLDGNSSGSVTIPAATTSTAGVMSAADKEKLDSLSQGGDITAVPTDVVIEEIEPNLVSTAIRKTPQVLTDSEKEIARGNIGAADAMETSIAITTAIEKGRQLALRALYVAAGAEYNDSGIDKTKTAPWGETVTHKAGHYYLNGLGDITEKQMLAIYNRGVFNDSEKAPFGNAPISRLNNIRTNLCRVGMWNGVLSSYLCISNKTIEVVNLHITNSNNVTDSCFVSFSDTESLFKDASNLSVIDTRCILKSATWKNTTFTGCKKLKELKITSLGNNIVFKDSPLLSKATVLYMIQKSTTTSTITIILHADAYARLANDADIVAALEAKPLVTLVSA